MDSVFDLVPADLNYVELGVYVVAVVLSSFLSGYFWSLRLTRRGEALDRVNKQLGTLYGPLRMLRYAAETAFTTFKKKYFPDRPELFWNGVEPSEEVYALWRTWLKFTLMPINKEIQRLLLEHGDLIEGREIPQPVLEFFAHVSALDATIAQWDQNILKDFKSRIRYPIEFNRHVEETYKSLIRRRSSF